MNQGILTSSRGPEHRSHVSHPQGSILGPVLFNIFSNDLWHSVKHSTKCTYADDTQISFVDKEPTKVEEGINSDLMSKDRWYEENNMKRNPDKY